MYLQSNRGLFTQMAPGVFQFCLCVVGPFYRRRFLATAKKSCEHSGEVRRCNTYNMSILETLQINLELKKHWTQTKKIIDLQF